MAKRKTICEWIEMVANSTPANFIGQRIAVSVRIQPKGPPRNLVLAEALMFGLHILKSSRNIGRWRDWTSHRLRSAVVLAFHRRRFSDSRALLHNLIGR